MSLSNRDIENLKTRLNKNKSLSVTSKTNLNRFIENTKNAFDRTAYNTRMRNLRNRDASLGINSRNGSVYRGSVNPGKRGRNSPRGPLSAVSGTSNTSNNQNNASTNGYGGFSNNENNLERNAKRRKSNSQPQPPPPLVTVATAAARAAKAADNRAKANANARAAANNARRKAVANAKKKAIIAQQQGKAAANNARRKAVANARAAANNARRKAVENANKKAKAAAAAQAAENAKAKAKKAKAEKQEKNRKNAQKTINKAITNKRQRNANELNMLRKAKAKAAKAAAAQAAENAKAAAAQAAENAKAKAATPANSARVSATTLGTPNQSLNNNASSASIIKPANKRNSKEKAGKLMKEGILLEITKQAQRTASMKNLNNLRKLNGSLNSPNSIKEYDTYAWALLYDMVKGLYDTKFEVDGKPINVSLKTLKQIHEKLRQKNIYSSGRTTGGEGNRRRFDAETFNNDEIVEFMLLIWLDGSHDAYITSSFLAWLDSPTCKQYFNNRHRELAKSFVKDFPNPTNFKDTFKKNPKGFKIFKTGIFENIKGYDTIRKICIETEAVWFFIHDFNQAKNEEQTTSKRMIGKVFTKDKKTSLSGNFEKELKLGIKEILNTRQTNEIYSGGEISNLKRSGVKIVSLDMEADGDILSEAIRETDSFRPFVTAASLIDPGKHMNKTSAGRKDVQLVLSAMESGKVDLLNKLQCQYYIGPLNFTIMDKIKTKNGKNNNLPFLEINLSIKQGGPSITNEGRVSTLDFFDLKVNDKKVLKGATAANARNGSPEAKMGKFMGDALQYMVVAIQNKYRGRERYFASGDGSACFMYVYFCNKLNIKPKLIIDKGDERIRTIGLRNN